MRFQVEAVADESPLPSFGERNKDLWQHLRLRLMAGATQQHSVDVGGYLSG